MTLSRKKGPQCLAKTVKAVSGAAQCTKHAKPGRFLCAEHETRAREGKEVIGFRSGKPILIQPSRAEGGTGVTRKTPPLARPPRSGAALEPATDSYRLDTAAGSAVGSLFLSVTVERRRDGKKFVPMKLDLSLNSRGNPFKKARQVAAERTAVREALSRQTFKVLSLLVQTQALKPGRIVVRLIRVSPRWRKFEDGTPKPPVDSDNLQGRLKAVRDEVASVLGVDDGDERVVRYTYGQERGPSALRIEFWEE